MMDFKPGRRALLLGAAALLAGTSACMRRDDAGPSSLLKDLRDRPLAVTPPVGKLSIDDSRFLIALSLIHPDPVSLLAAWAGDVNRLAGVYHWAGTSDAGALRILDRLDVVAQRPLVDIVPIRPAPAPVLDAAGQVVDANRDGYYPQTTTQRQRPVGLRIVQTLKNSATPADTTFGLRRAYNCFWITL